MIKIDTSKKPVKVPELGVQCWVSELSTVPLFVDCGAENFRSAEALIAWTKQHFTCIERLIVEYGGIVLKNSPLWTAADFNDFTSLFPQFARGYVGGSAPRARVSGNVMESTRLAQEFRINLHQEMAYLKEYPARVAFFCRIAAEEGGETTIGNMREFTRRLPASVREKLEKHGVRGVRNYAPIGHSGVARHSDDQSWDQNFGTRDRAEVDAICKSMDMEAHWNADGSLTVVSYTDAFASHPVTGEKFYRSIIHSNYLIYEKYAGEVKQIVDDLRTRQKYPTGYTFGNGESLSREESRVLERTLEEITLGWSWAAGDVMILDNLQTAHGRSPYKGDRETLVALLN